MSRRAKVLLLLVLGVLVGVTTWMIDADEAVDNKSPFIKVGVDPDPRGDPGGGPP